MFNISLLLDIKILPGSIEWWLIFLPVLLFVVFAIMLFLRMKNSSITLSKLLAEKDLVMAQQTAAIAAANANEPPPPTTPPPASSSRLISLLTGVTATIISVGLTSTWIYGYVLNPSSGGPDFKNITTLLITLGIGVIPYGFNRISSTAKSS